MATARYIGPLGEDTLLTQSELQGQQVEVVTQSQITSAIDSALEGKANAEYVQSAISDKERVDNLPGYSEGLLESSRIGQPGGVAPLQDGRVPDAHLPNSAGGFPWRFLGTSPNWNTGVLYNDLNNPLQVCTWTLPDLGYPYIPIFMGYCLLGDPRGGEVQIRYGSRTGRVFSRAASSNQAFYDSCGFTPAEGVSSIRSGTFHVVAGRKFNNEGSALGANYSLSAFAVPA